MADNKNEQKCSKCGTNDNLLKLQCFHYYCQNCHETLDRITRDDVEQVYCVDCGEYYSIDLLSGTANQHELIQLVVKGIVENYFQKEPSLLNREISENSLCKSCKSRITTYKCLECKLKLCEICRGTHSDIPQCKEHSVLPLLQSQFSTVFVEGNMCPDHPTYKMKHNCKDCCRVICPECRNQEHNKHLTETVKDALIALLPRMTEEIEEAKAINEVIETSKLEMNNSIPLLNTKYDEIITTAKRDTEDKCNKLQQNLQQFVSETEKKRLINIDKINTELLSLEESSNDLKCILTLGDKIDNGVLETDDFIDMQNILLQKNDSPQTSQLGVFPIDIPTFVPIQLELDTTVGKIEYFCKPLLDAPCTPDVGTLGEPKEIDFQDVKPKTSRLPSATSARDLEAGADAVKTSNSKRRQMSFSTLSKQPTVVREITPSRFPTENKDTKHLDIQRPQSLPKEMGIEGQSQAVDIAESQQHLSTGIPPVVSAVPHVKEHILGNFRQHRLGGGAFGNVYKGTLNGTPVAIKEINISKHGNRRKRKNENDKVLKEIKISADAKHPNVVQLMAYSIDKSSVRIIYELIEGSNLDDIIFDDEESKLYNLCFGKKLQIAKSVGKAIAYLHEMEIRIIHGDMKPANIMVSLATLDTKLCDLGTSKLKDRLKKTTTVGTGRIGTPNYMAPEELLNNTSPTTKTDIYSTGVTLVELFTDEPYWDISEHSQPVDEIKKYMTDKRNPCHVDKITPARLKDCIVQCLHYDPEHRIKGLKLANTLTELEQDPKMASNTLSSCDVVTRENVTADSVHQSETGLSSIASTTLQQGSQARQNQQSVSSRENSQTFLPRSTDNLSHPTGTHISRHSNLIFPTNLHTVSPRIHMGNTEGQYGTTPIGRNTHTLMQTHLWQSVPPGSNLGNTSVFQPDIRDTYPIEGNMHSHNPSLQTYMPAPSHAGNFTPGGVARMQHQIPHRMPLVHVPFQSAFVTENFPGQPLSQHPTYMATYSVVERPSGNILVPNTLSPRHMASVPHHNMHHSPSCPDVTHHRGAYYQ